MLYKHDWLQTLAHHLVLGIGHEAIKASFLRLKIVHSELLDEHSSWGHCDLTVEEKRGSVWSDNGHFTCEQWWLYAVHMAQTSAVVCVGWCVFHLSYHPGVAAALQEWNKILGKDVHSWEKRVTCFSSSVMGFGGKQTKLLNEVSPMVLVAKFFSNPTTFSSLLCTMHPALFILNHKQKLRLQVIQAEPQASQRVKRKLPTSTFKDGYCCLKLSANSQTLRVSAMSRMWMWTSCKNRACMSATCRRLPLFSQQRGTLTVFPDSQTMHSLAFSALSLFRHTMCTVPPENEQNTQIIF